MKMKQVDIQFIYETNLFLCIYSLVEDDTKQDTRRLFWKQNQKVGVIFHAQPEIGTEGKEEMSKVD